MQEERSKAAGVSGAHHHCVSTALIIREGSLQSSDLVASLPALTVSGMCPRTWAWMSKELERMGFFPGVESHFLFLRCFGPQSPPQEALYLPSLTPVGISLGWKI